MMKKYKYQRGGPMYEATLPEVTIKAKRKDSPPLMNVPHEIHDTSGNLPYDVAFNYATLPLSFMPLPGALKYMKSSPLQGPQVLEQGLNEISKYLSQPPKDSKPKYQTGGDASAYYSPVGLPMDPSFILQQQRDEKEAKRKQTLQGILGVASTAASFIPGVGPAIGAGTSLLGNAMFNNGGKMMYGNGGSMMYEMGGDIPLASDSFQVKGNPNVTDGNAYGNVRLDHNEVVKDNFVFSDSLYNPSTGRKFSEEALEIEKSAKRAEKRSARDNDQISKTGMEFTKMMSKELATLQEQVAEAMGLRNRPQDGLREAPQSYQGGGEIMLDPPRRHYSTITDEERNSMTWRDPDATSVAPFQGLDNYFKYGEYVRDPGTKPTLPDNQGGGRINNQPYMQIPGLNNEYYDPYQNRMMLRNVDGSYKPWNYSKGKVEGDYLVQGSNRVSIADHLAKYPAAAPTAQPTPTQAPVPQARTYGIDPLQPPAYHRFYDPSKVAPPASTPVQPDMARAVNENYYWQNAGRGPFFQEGIPSTPPTAPFPLQAPPTSRAPGGRGTRKPSGTPAAKPDLTYMEVEELPYNYMGAPTAQLPNTRSGNFLPVSSTKNSLASRPEVGNAVAQMRGEGADTPQSLGNSLGSKTSIGDILQAATVASKFFGLRDKPQITYLDNTPISQEVYDPRAALFQNQQSYQGRINALDTPSENLRRGLANQMLSTKYSTDSQVATQYDNMNERARTNYEQRLSQRAQYNNQQSAYADDIRQRDRAQYRNNIDTAMQSVGEFGKSLGDKETAYDVLRMYREIYPDVYERLVGNYMNKRNAQ